MAWADPIGTREAWGSRGSGKSENCAERFSGEASVFGARTALH
jgi:hypothetical protein